MSGLQQLVGIGLQDINLTGTPETTCLLQRVINCMNLGVSLVRLPSNEVPTIVKPLQLGEPLYQLPKLSNHRYNWFQNFALEEDGEAEAMLAYMHKSTNGGYKMYQVSFGLLELYPRSPKHCGLTKNLLRVRMALCVVTALRDTFPPDVRVGLNPPNIRKVSYDGLMEYMKKVREAYTTLDYEALTDNQFALYTVTSTWLYRLG